MAALSRPGCSLVLLVCLALAAVALLPAAPTFTPGVVGHSVSSQVPTTADDSDLARNTALENTAPPTATAVTPLVATAAALGLLLGLVGGPQVAHAGGQALQGIDRPPAKGSINFKQRDMIAFSDPERLMSELKEDATKKAMQGSREARVKEEMQKMREMAVNTELPK
mmetsp:Transcript_56101/g.123162  ORF Transcript_56101/g.123162 Transcript_56101/m.123162 type:complete len:168 (+) Transcript_56101:74-577(+)